MSHKALNLIIRSILMVALVTAHSAVVSSQIKGIKPVKPVEEVLPGTTKAVVVGISDYQNPDIPDLQFAHKDAELFAEYLKDEKGANLPEENVTVLLNEQATAGNVISALYGLIEETNEGDQVIIYFSGHGDVESTTISQPGFLLCWDTPSRIYMSGGTFGLAYFQEIISTISQKTQSKVIVITDACRAGKLAGSSIGGAQATAAHLSKQYANEIKILSCQPNEFALESESWGEGRGVFSYFFLRGIQGLADHNEDGIVTLREIDRYLEDWVTPAADPHSQIPMTIGNRQAKLFPVNEEAKAALQKEADVSLSKINQRSLSMSDITFTDSIRRKTYEDFQEAMSSHHLLFPLEGSAWQIFQEIKSYEELKPYVGLMRRNLAAALQNESQQVINRYVEGDEEELKRRWSYDVEYWEYPEQLRKAAELLGPEHFYYQPLLARTYYFEGLVSRLEAERTDNDSLLQVAVALQDSCLSLQPDAVHAINEKGYTYYLMEDYDRSILEFNQANSLISNWPLVWTNLSSSYKELNQIDKARECALQALAIDSTYMLGYFKLASSYQSEDSLDRALELYKEIIALDDELPFVYDRIGYIYKLKEDEAKAKEYSYKAYLLDSMDIDVMINLAHYSLDLGQTDDAYKYFSRARALNPEALRAFQGSIEYYYYTGDMDNAQSELLAYLAVYPDDEFAHYLLASIYASQGDEASSLQSLEQAFKLGFDDLETLQGDSNMEAVLSTDAYRQLLQKYGVKE